MQNAPTSARGTGRMVLITVTAVVVFVPAMLAAWIGLIFLAERVDMDLTANEVFAWLIAAIVALVLWPITLRATRRQFWAQRQRKLGNPDPAKNVPGPPVPKVRIATGDLLGRVAVVILGALALLLISGSQEITTLLTLGIGAASSGPRSAWLLLQLAVFLLLFALFLPVLWLTDRTLRRVPPADPRRRALEIKQDWYLAAVTAWVACLVLGYLFAYLVLTRL
ncbi:MAG: hypothetical protein JF592_08160 [Microbacterium sp.]|uniref:hypothetical protein n=1 Tax=Microbacterium sp. TaxID=51671 RepID=UPI001D55C159|nr:hypothetical protein [Microbacterium sp.]MBW8762546.1 hypothetical protein [Microbacterium sp.]